MCPRGEIGRHKGLKILALLGVPVRVWPRAPKRKLDEEISFIFDKTSIKSQKLETSFLKRYKNFSARNLSASGLRRRRICLKHSEDIQKSKNHFYE